MTGRPLAMAGKRAVHTGGLTKCPHDLEVP